MVVYASVASACSLPDVGSARRGHDKHFLESCGRAVEFSLTHLLHEQAVFFAERLVAELPSGQQGSGEAIHVYIYIYIYVCELKGPLKSCCSSYLSATAVGAAKSRE